MPEKTETKRASIPPVEHQFKPGNSGRPKGARNKLGEQFIKALQEDFEKHGVKAIADVRSDKPDQYLKVIASLMPKEHRISVEDQFNEMSDDEIADRIRQLASTLAPFLVDGTGGADEAGEGAAVEEIAPRVH